MAPVVEPLTDAEFRRRHAVRPRAERGWEQWGRRLQWTPLETRLAELPDLRARQRSRALWEIGRTYDWRAWEAVVPHLESRSVRVRVEAAWALEHLNAPEAGPALLSRLSREQDERVRLCILIALVWARVEQARPVFESILAGPEEPGSELHRNAVLGIRFLDELARDRSEGHRTSTSFRSRGFYMCDCRVELDGRFTALTEDGEVLGVDSRTTAADEGPSRSTHPLVRMLERRTEPMERVEWRIVGIGDPDASVEALAEPAAPATLETLLRLFDWGGSLVPGTYEAVAGLLRHPSPGVRAAATLSLPDATESKDLAEEAARGEEAARSLAEGYAAEPEPGVRHMMLLALAELDFEPGRELLLTEMRSRDPLARGVAASALANLDYRDSLDPLKLLLRNEENPFARRRAEAAIAALGEGAGA